MRSIEEIGKREVGIAREVYPAALKREQGGQSYWANLISSHRRDLSKKTGMTPSKRHQRPRKATCLNHVIYSRGIISCSIVGINSATVG